MAICKGCGKKYSVWTTPVSARGVCLECFESELENEPEAQPQEEYTSVHENAFGEKADASPKWVPPPAVVGFFPRSESKIVFVLAMACYGWVASAFIRTLAGAFNAPGPPAGLFMLHGRPTARVWDLLLFAPIFESLILVGNH